MPGSPFISTAAATASATPSPCKGVGRSPKSATDSTMGTSTPRRVNTEEKNGAVFMDAGTVGTQGRQVNQPRDSAQPAGRNVPVIQRFGLHGRKGQQRAGDIVDKIDAVRTAGVQVFQHQGQHRAEQ